MSMTSEEGDENQPSGGVVLNGNPPMTNVPTEVLKEFMASSADGSSVANSISNRDLTSLENKAMQLPVVKEIESSTDENPTKKIRLNRSKIGSNSAPILSASSEKVINKSVLPYNNTLALAMSSSSISLTQKQQNVQSETSSAVDKPKSSMHPEENSPFLSSSVSLTVKVPTSIPTNDTLEKPFSLPKSPKNDSSPPESLADLEKKIVGSVSISPKNVDTPKSTKDIDEDLLFPASPFSDTSSHISLSLEESLLREQEFSETETPGKLNESERDSKNEVKTRKSDVSDDVEEKLEKLFKGNKLKNDENGKENVIVEIQKDLSVEKNKVKPDLDEEGAENLTNEKSESVVEGNSSKEIIKSSNAIAKKDYEENKKEERNNFGKIIENKNETNLCKDDKNKDLCDLDLEISKKNEIAKENKKQENIEVALNLEKEVEENKENISLNENDSVVDDIFELDEGSVDDFNESNLTMAFDEKDDLENDSDGEIIKPAIDKLIGSLTESGHAEGPDKSNSSGGSKRSTIGEDGGSEKDDQLPDDKMEDEESDKDSSIEDEEMEVTEEIMKSNSSSKEVGNSSLPSDAKGGYSKEDSVNNHSSTSSNSNREASASDNDKNSASNLIQIAGNRKSVGKSSIDKIRESSQTSYLHKGKAKPKILTAKSSSALTFTEALKSIEADSEELYPALKAAPEPLTPSAEFVSNETLDTDNSLTVLQPVLTADSVLQSSVLQSLKRPLSDLSNGGEPKPNLKRIRVFKTRETDPLAKDSDVRKSPDRSSVLMNMEKCLEAEKANQISNESSNKISMDDVDPEELRRRTALELEKSKQFKSLPKYQRIKRKDLESLVVELFMDKVLYEHELGQQRDLCKRLEATLETNRKKAAQFHKEVEDLKKVTQRLQAEHVARKGQVVAPVKVKRSVGIQATPSIIGKGLMHASSASNSTIKLLSPSKTISVSTSPSRTTNNQSTVVAQTSEPSPKESKPLSKKQNGANVKNSRTVTTAVQTNTVAVSGGGKVRQIQTARVVVSQPTSSPGTTGIQTNTMTPMVMVNSQQQIVVSQGAVSSLLPPNTRFVRATANPISSSVATTPTQAITHQIINTSVVPSSNGLQRISSVATSGGGLIDLTDDEEIKGAQMQARLTTSAVLVNRGGAGMSSSGTTSQYVTIPHQSQMGQLLLVPSSNGGSPTAALVVGNMPGNAQTIVSGPASGVMRANVLSSNNQRIAPGTRVVVGTQMNGGTMIQTIPKSLHPAPLPKAPPQQTSGYSKKLPPMPILKLSHKDNSIVLSWNMNKTEEHEGIASYQLFAYQEGSALASPALWKKVGSVKALELPMACTLTQFMPGHVYHFAVRAVDIKCRLGPFSEPKSIRLGKLGT